jgi:hypothetical protein
LAQLRTAAQEMVVGRQRAFLVDRSALTQANRQPRVQPFPGD